ncbi:MAG: TetR/AcrR family transcriptional regulator [Vulcanimicrobiaceae bacterium]
MSPRPYRQGAKRQAATEKTRARIIDAARALLMSDAPGAFSIDAVARGAGVARMTVYYQFESKAGLLSALFDDLGARGEMFRLREAFMQDDPLEALARFIDVFMIFYDRNRVFVRRLNALTALEQAMAERAGWRREGLRTLLERFTQRYHKPRAAMSEHVLAVLHSLISFDTFDSLAGGERTPEQTGNLLFQLARAALDLEA